MEWAKVPLKSSTYDGTQKKSANPNQKCLSIVNYKTFCVFWAFEQLSAVFGARVTLKQSMQSCCFAAKSSKLTRCGSVNEL